MAERITNLRLKIAAAVTLGPAAVLGGQACGGGDSGAKTEFVTQTPVSVVKIENSVTSTPTAVVTKVAEAGTPVSGGDTSKGPGSGVEPTKVPAATPTEAPKATEAPKSNIPAEAQPFFNDLKNISSFTPADIEAVTKGFETSWAQASTERQKWSAYSSLYSSLWSKFNQTKDQALVGEMKKLEDFMAVKWPSFYNPNSGGWYRP